MIPPKSRARPDTHSSPLSQPGRPSCGLWGRSPLCRWSGSAHGCGPAPAPRAVRPQRDPGAVQPLEPREPRGQRTPPRPGSSAVSRAGSPRLVTGERSRSRGTSPASTSGPGCLVANPLDFCPAASGSRAPPDPPQARKWSQPSCWAPAGSGGTDPRLLQAPRGDPGHPLLAGWLSPGSEPLAPPRVLLCF